MAVRSGEDRRVGGQPEKLLTLEEAARRLQVPADDVEAMIRQGKLASFRLGGSLVRVRLREVEAMAKPRQEVSPRMPIRTARARGKPPTAWERVIDFFYFNDFYIVVLVLLLTLLAIIFTL